MSSFQFHGRIWNALIKFCNTKSIQSWYQTPWIEDNCIYATDGFHIVRWTTNYTIGENEWRQFNVASNKVLATQLLDFEDDFTFFKTSDKMPEADKLFRGELADKNDYSYYNANLINDAMNLAKAIGTEEKIKPIIRMSFDKYNDATNVLAIQIVSKTLGTFDIICMPWRVKDK